MTNKERKRIEMVPLVAKIELADAIFAEICSKTVKANWRDPATKIAFAKFVEQKLEHYYFSDWAQPALGIAESTNGL